MDPRFSRRALMMAGLGGVPFLSACGGDDTTAPTSNGPTVTTSTIREQAGAKVSIALAAAGGKAPYTWQMVMGRVPGLQLSKDGALSGTPERPGVYDLTVIAEDARGNVSAPAPITVTIAFTGAISPAVVAIGTSLTGVLQAGGQVLVRPWPSQWQSMWGYVATNLSRPGRSSVILACSVGALAWRSAAPVEVPASGGVEIPVSWEVDGAVTPATFGDIEGTLSRRPFESLDRPTVGYFRRSSEGRPTTLPVGTPLRRHRTDVDYGARTIFVEAVRNDFLRPEEYDALPKDYQRELNDLDKTLERVRSIVTVLSGGRQDAHVIVVGQPLATGDDKAARGEVNAAVKAAFGASYADPWAWLRSDAAAKTVGLTLTGKDRAEGKRGDTPTSLRIDGLHPNTLAHTALSHFYWDLLKERGWR